MIETKNKPDMARAIFRLISRNTRKGTHHGTDEELLQEVVDELKDALEGDLVRNKDRDRFREEDIKYKYKDFVRKVNDKADQFKQYSQAYRRICCLPSFALGLVMASRIPSHYTHAPWFRLGVLTKMIDVHGAVSIRVKTVAQLTSHLTRVHAVRCRIYRRKR
jgi:hypothetical protein